MHGRRATQAIAAGSNTRWLLGALSLLAMAGSLVSAKLAQQHEPAVTQAPPAAALSRSVAALAAPTNELIERAVHKLHLDQLMPRAQIVHNVDQMLAELSKAGYDLAGVRKGTSDVPRVFLAVMPRDLPEINVVDKRKSVFVQVMLPLILRENERIAADRERLIQLSQKETAALAPSADDHAWLRDLAESYGVRGSDLDELLVRVDIIPPSLALSQSAEESGWGTSRLALTGNALFGQSVWANADGIPVDEGTDGATYQIRTFNGLEASIAAYMRNLNTHNAYRGFRKARAAFRAQGLELDGHALTTHLQHYSERGQDYIKSVQVIMRTNDFDEFDAARLGSTVVAFRAML